MKAATLKGPSFEGEPPLCRPLSIVQKLAILEARAFQRHWRGCSFKGPPLKGSLLLKAAEYCAKASDPGGTCLSKAQTTFFTHGPDRKDSVVKAADIS